MLDTHYEDAWGEDEEGNKAQPLVDAARQAREEELKRERDEFSQAYRETDEADKADGHDKGDEEGKR